MANVQVPYTKTLLAAVAVAGSTQVNGTAIDMPCDLDSGTFIAAAVYNAGATLDVAIEGSPDGGTTWFKWWAFTQITTASISYAIDVAFSRTGEAGAIETVTHNATTLVTGALVANKPLPPHIRVSYQGDGTADYTTLAVYFIGHKNQPAG